MATIDLKKMRPVALTAAALLLGGCAAASDGTSPTDLSVSDERLLDALHESEYGFGQTGLDEDWLALADLTCASFEEGLTQTDAAESLIEGGMTYDEAWGFIGAVSTIYCPEEAGFDF